MKSWASRSANIQPSKPILPAAKSFFPSRLVKPFTASCPNQKKQRVRSGPSSGRPVPHSRLTPKTHERRCIDIRHHNEVELLQILFVEEQAGVRFGGQVDPRIQCLDPGRRRLDALHEMPSQLVRRRATDTAETERTFWPTSSSLTK